MALPKQFELNLARIQKLLDDLKLSEADAARIAKMSVNTVKALLTQKGGSGPSVLKLERALDIEKQRRDALIAAGQGGTDLPLEFSEQLALALTLSTTLSSVLHKMTISAPPTSNAVGAEELTVLKRNIKAAQANLDVLS